MRGGARPGAGRPAKQPPSPPPVIEATGPLDLLRKVVACTEVPLSDRIRCALGLLPYQHVRDPGRKLLADIEARSVLRGNDSGPTEQTWRELLRLPRDDDAY